MYSPKASEDDYPHPFGQSFNYSPPRTRFHYSMGGDSTPDDSKDTYAVFARFITEKKLEHISYIFHNEYKPQCLVFNRYPPNEATDRQKLHARLGEEILQHVLLRLDAVTADDDVLRRKKKQLISDAQNALEQLDEGMEASAQVRV